MTAIPTAYIDPIEVLEQQASRRPHHVNPSITSLRVILAVKNFANTPGVCHIGLGVTATNTLKVLRRFGVHVEAWAVQTADDLKKRLSKEHTRTDTRAQPITHVIISAPSWVQPCDFGFLSFNYPEIEFVQLNHSGCAYLSIDKYGIRNIREVIDLCLSSHNIRVAGNNPRFTNWVNGAFSYDCALLPNLYDTESFVNPYPMRSLAHTETLHVGSFGASRPWKNQLVAAEAAVELAKRLNRRLVLHVNSKRPDGGERMIESRGELFHNLPGCRVEYVQWAMWPHFRRILSTMDILFQPSFDETFNVVTADGIAEGIPSVTTSAIEWTPRSWWCSPEDPHSLVQVAMTLLQDPHAIHSGRQTLTDFVAHGVRLWINYLTRRSSRAVYTE